MNQQNFSCDKSQQKAAIVKAQGKFLTDRLNGKHFVYLFSMDTFFAEIWYRRDNFEIDLVLTFRSTALLEPYLEEMSLEQLLGS
ncbi:MAG: hypothetical protein M3Q05_12615 [Bacteroidota bacterium]|nr:hypothetical protein [Bacteroidota bacterium]